MAPHTLEHPVDRPTTPPATRRYRAAWWIPGPHLRTLWGKFLRRSPTVDTRRERWTTADGDSVTLQRLAPARPDAPRLLYLHGLEGTERSHYVGGMFAEAAARGWGMDLLLFRSCAGESNTARRFYHSGETTDLAMVLDRLLAETAAADENDAPPIVLAGVSLGGNVLLKFLGERTTSLPRRVIAAAAVSVPFDLARGSRHLQQGFARIYERHFLQSLTRKAAQKMERYPDLVAPGTLTTLRTLWDFDHQVTAPLHGFTSAADYYERSSSLHFLPHVSLPTLLLSAEDDPFLPSVVLDEVRDIAGRNPMLHVEFVARGGHVGFISGVVPWRPVYWAEHRVAEFLAAQIEAGIAERSSHAVTLSAQRETSASQPQHHA